MKKLRPLRHTHPKGRGSHACGPRSRRGKVRSAPFPPTGWQKLRPLPCPSSPRVATSSIFFASAHGESSSIPLRLLSPQKRCFCGGPRFRLAGFARGPQIVEAHVPGKNGISTFLRLRARTLRGSFDAQRTGGAIGPARALSVRFIPRPGCGPTPVGRPPGSPPSRPASKAEQGCPHQNRRS